MFLEYDPETDCGFLWLRPPEPGIIAYEIWPMELREHIGLLFDEDRRLVGLEVLFAGVYLNPETLSRAQTEPKG